MGDTNEGGKLNGLDLFSGYGGINDEAEILRVLTKLNRYIVRLVTKLWSLHLSHHPQAQDDLLQSGRIAVMLAVRGRKPEFDEVQFLCYARMRVWGSVMDEIRAQHWGSKFAPALRDDMNGEMPIERIPDECWEDVLHSMIDYREQRDQMLHQLTVLELSARHKRIIRGYLSGQKMVKLCDDEGISRAAGYAAVDNFTTKAQERIQRG